MGENQSLEQLFLDAQETYEQAQQRAQSENVSFARTEYFRMDKTGLYRLRVLPIAPNRDGTADRRSYEYPVHQYLMEIEKPSASKPSSLYITVARATEAGYSLDLIDTYRKEALEKAQERGDEKLVEKLNSGSFGGGLKYSYNHALYILDLNARSKGMQLLTLSHSQFNDLDERKFKLWQKKLSKNTGYPCPISSVYNAYPVEIEKKKNGAKTEYVIGIDNEAEADMLSREELNALMNAPRIPEVVYRYSRYHLQATVEFLKQCDSRYELSLMQSAQMKEAVEQLSSELPKDDTSSFSFDKRSKENKDSVNAPRLLDIDYLYNKYDELQSQDLSDKTEEGQELRAMIRAFIEQERIPIRITRATSNCELLSIIDAELQKGDNPFKDDDLSGQPSGTDSVPATQSPVRRR